MSVADAILPRSLLVEAAHCLRAAWRRIAHVRLGQVARDAPILPFDDSSRLVFLSDTHRGDRSRADVFAPNEALYLAALGKYLREGYTYIEVGDGDELWQNRFADVRRAHARTFDMLDAFHREGRLHLLVGNHDVAHGRGDRVEKGELVAREGLLLRHKETGHHLFAVHGHQADLPADRLSGASRLVVRRVWRQALNRGVAAPHGNPAAWRRLKCVMHRLERWLRSQFEEHLAEWAVEAGRVVICGHTHVPVGAGPGDPPYYNTGSCVRPGVLHGIEVVHGQISQVRWVATPWRNGAQAERQVVGPRRPLRHVL